MTARHDEDEDLRRAFADLRRTEEGRVPPLADLLRRPGPRRRWALRPLVGGALAAAALVAAVAAGLSARRAPAPPPALASIEDWRAPTDFLLRTPGSDVLRTVPRIGTLPPNFTPAGAPALEEKDAMP